jgi:hypothetical protein
MKNEIQEILSRTLPAFHTFVYEHKPVFGSAPWIMIGIAALDHNINGVRGQMPQVVSLALDTETLELWPQMSGGCGGQCIERQPNLADPKEKYLAMKSVKVPFRKPKPEHDTVLRAIERFALAYKQTLIANKEVLCYQELVDYNKILS